MNNDAQNSNEANLKAIFGLDLEPIKAKLMSSSEGAGWTRSTADRCELEYKRFLAMAVTFRGAGIVPSVEVDQFWHAHILDTRKYADDCATALGFFLHHSPDYGKREAKDVEALESAFSQTRELYEQLFGNANDATPAWCAVAEDKAEKKAAWCAVAEAEEKKAAWCAVAEDKAEKKAAWCAVAEDKAEKKAAWCAVAEDKAEKKAAWCAVAEDKAEKKAAWCAVAEDKAEKKAAWCAVADEDAAINLAAASLSNMSHVQTGVAVH